ncbi:MAG: HEAT repeat domain-containing protein [Planctomycetes bacterium]|nr:HEAT repeat domain-containing protein [Planctomycetota bacterium]
MAIKVRCPGCRTRFSLDDIFKGKKVRCKNCDESFVVSRKPQVEEEPEEQIQEESPKTPPARKPRQRDTWDEPEPFQRKLRSKEKKEPLALMIGGVILAVLLLVSCAGGGVWFLFFRNPSGPKTTPTGVQIQSPMANQPAGQGQPPRSSDVVTQALQDLQSPDYFTRQRALERLGTTPPNDRRREVSLALEPFLNDPDVFHLQAAIKAYALWAGPDGIPRLIFLLKNTDALTKPKVAEALGQFKDERAAEALAQQLSEFQDRSMASSALRKMGAVAEPAVLKQLQNPDGQVQAEACRILTAIGTQRSVPALQTASQSSQPLVSLEAQAALRVIAARH